MLLRLTQAIFSCQLKRNALYFSRNMHRIWRNRMVRSPKRRKLMYIESDSPAVCASAYWWLLGIIPDLSVPDYWNLSQSALHFVSDISSSRNLPQTSLWMRGTGVVQYLLASAPAEEMLAAVQLLTEWFTSSWSCASNVWAVCFWSCMDTVPKPSQSQRQCSGGTFRITWIFKFLWGIYKHRLSLWIFSTSLVCVCMCVCLLWGFALPCTHVKAMCVNVWTAALGLMSTFSILCQSAVWCAIWDYQSICCYVIVRTLRRVPFQGVV